MTLSSVSGRHQAADLDMSNSRVRRFETYQGPRQAAKFFAVHRVRGVNNSWGSRATVARQSVPHGHNLEE